MPAVFSEVGEHLARSALRPVRRPRERIIEQNNAVPIETDAVDDEDTLPPPGVIREASPLDLEDLPLTEMFIQIVGRVA
ncbi:hypothetical protein GWI33_010415 [Rhynchophorus ferrugineus]|uniref:Uncharacterized protein n=1 Tax=Rhynchophorus ferrugineus TaxID=354439 RepID=A0A834IXC2_RHYFE|nr:hypothetical protein GWI33_010415 [Rhynchophorus ferrugineus]